MSNPLASFSGPSLDSAGLSAELGRLKIVPVLTIDDPGVAREVGAALKAGGLPVAEVTFRTPAAAQALQQMAADRDLLVGAGTVVDAAQVDEAVALGARFVVSPGFKSAVVRRAHELGIPIIPGAATPSEVMAIAEYGLTLVKLFPAEPLGGVKMVTALAGPFPTIKFLPTGGIAAAQLRSYLDQPSVLAVGGSWMVPASAIASRSFDELTRLSAESVRTASETS